MSGDNHERNTFGMLLGWKGDPAGEKIALLMQSTTKKVERDEDVREFRYFLTRQQAVQLGNFLYTMAGETAPKTRRRGFLDRLLGG